MDRLLGAIPAVVFALFMVTLLAGKTRSSPNRKRTPARPPRLKEPASDTSSTTGWRWGRARRDRLVTVERVAPPKSQSEPRPPSPSRPVLRAVPDPPYPDPEGLDPVSIIRRAAQLARQRRSAPRAKAVPKATAKGDRSPTTEVEVLVTGGKGVHPRSRVAKEAAQVLVVRASSVEESVAGIGAPAGGQMQGLVETITESLALLARIPPGGDIRNPIAQIAAFAQVQAALARNVAEHRQRMVEDRHDPLVLGVAEQAEAITRTAATALGETALTAAVRYRGMAADQAAGTRAPNVHRH